MNVVYQFNEKYAPYAGVSIVSLINSNPNNQINIHILGEDLSDISKKRLMSFSDGRIKVLIYDTDDMISKMKKLGVPSYRGSYAANLRLFLPEFLEAKIDRVLYLDADTVIVGEIDKLIKYNLQGKCIGMVLDSLGGKNIQNIGLERKNYYFNSGVIVFDLKKWKDKKYSEKIISHIKNKRAVYPSPDQDLLNIVCRGDIEKLPISYNYQPIHSVVSNKCFDRTFCPAMYYTFEEIENDKTKIVVYHCFRFNGEFPWHKDNLHPFANYFDYFLNVSPWKDYEKQRASTSLVLKIEKILYRLLPQDLYGYVFYIAHRLYMRSINRKILEKKIDKIK